MALRPLLLMTPVLAALTLPAAADDRDHREHDRDHREHDRDHHDRDRHDHRDHHDFHGHDFRFFTPLELSLWTGGAWFHEWHDGRLGWWWVADGAWYWYPEPVYPYPTYVSEPVAVVQPPPPPAYPPPPAPVVAPPPQEGAPPPASWYYCDNPQGYYPYVQQCMSGWRQVPAGR